MNKVTARLKNIEHHNDGHCVRYWFSVYVPNLGVTEYGLQVNGEEYSLLNFLGDYVDDYKSIRALLIDLIPRIKNGTNA